MLTKPIAVAHGSKAGSSEISSCNYVARSMGVHSGMWMARARKLCPELVVLPYDFSLYEAIIEKIYEILFTSGAVAVEAVSVDEAYLEFAAGSSGRDTANGIRARLLAETACPASAGVGANMLLARLATKKAKPNGCFELVGGPGSEGVCNFLATFPVSELPGVGHSLTTRLRENGLETCGDVAKWTKEKLSRIFGPGIGSVLWDSCRGIDERALSGG